MTISNPRNLLYRVHFWLKYARGESMCGILETTARKDPLKIMRACHILADWMKARGIRHRFFEKI
jgi:hypothetical protein